MSAQTLDERLDAVLATEDGQRSVRLLAEGLAERAEAARRSRAAVRSEKCKPCDGTGDDGSGHRCDHTYEGCWAAKCGRCEDCNGEGERYLCVNAGCEDYAHRNRPGRTCGHVECGGQ